MASKSKTKDPAPTNTRKVTVKGEEFTEVKEGLGRILNPVAPTGNSEDVASEEERQKVFYNPIQQFNRDLTVLAIKAYGEEVATKRRAAAERRINNKKRKREATEDGRPQIQEASAATANAAVPATKVAAVTSESAGDPMDISEPRKEQQPNGTIQTGQVEGSVQSGSTDAEVASKDQSAEAPRQRNLQPPKFTILDALSATGLRALRYAQELPFVTSVTANDLTPSAVEAIKRNVEHNGVESKVKVTQGDARAHMFSLIAEEVTREHEKNPRGFKKGPNAPTGKYDVIDLDPYGTAATFFDAAVHAVRDDGGLLCVTCTDSGVWASNGYPEKAYSLYGGVTVKGFYSHEVGLRLVLHGLATTAARHGLTTEPLLSLSIDYYLRIFVRIRKSAASVKFLAGKTMSVYSCDQGCGAWETQLLLRNKKVPNVKGNGVFYKHSFAQAPTTDSNCKHCGSLTHLAGPMYAGSLHSAEFIQRILSDLPDAPKDVYGTTARIEGMLHTALEEMSLPAPEDPLSACKDDELAALDPYPFFFHPTILAGAVHCSCPDEESFRGALRGLGYESTRSHCKPGSIKTNAPWSVIWHIMREWVRQKAPVKIANIKEGSAAFRLLRLGQESANGQSGEPEKNDIDKLEVVFNQALGKDKSKKGITRYQMNPKENWGPLTRPGFRPSLPEFGRLTLSFEMATVGETVAGHQPSLAQQDGHFKVEEVVCVSRDTAQRGYDVFALQENANDKSKPFKLAAYKVQDLAESLLHEFLVVEMPEYLQNTPTRKVHIVVSTGSGTGLALSFYQLVLQPLLEGLGLTDSKSYALTVTQDAQSIRRFARDLNISTNGPSGSDLQHTVILLSGDGGTIELLNGKAPGDELSKADTSLPLIATLPLGTGNALFHSLHKPLYAAPDATGPSPLVLGLRTLLRGQPKPLPSFNVAFSAGSRTITYSKPEDNPVDTSEGVIKEQFNAISNLYGAIVASYGLHSQLVWESDTPEYRRYGSKRFQMVAAELMMENHAYNAKVELEFADGSTQSQLDREKHAYILTTMVSNLEKAFTISPASQPLDGQLRIVHFGPVPADKAMEIMMQAYNNGNHVGMKWEAEDGKTEQVGYDPVKQVNVTTHEEDSRWRKVCVDGTIVEIPKGGSMTVTTESKPHLQVLVHQSVDRPLG
ncbi:tRNA (guanine(26)-N(2))-dimethyltransferase, mitochondrial [Seiridium cupressi]